MLERKFGKQKHVIDGLCVCCRCMCLFVCVYMACENFADWVRLKVFAEVFYFSVSVLLASSVFSSSEETMKRLLDNMFISESPPDHIVVSGIQFLLTCLERRCVFRTCIN